MQDLWAWLLGGAGGIVVLYQAAKAITDAYSPIKKTNQKIEKHEECLHRDKERLDEIEKTNALICKALFVMIDHDLTGNSIDNLKKAKNDLQEYLINR